MKFEAAGIHFLSDVFVAVAVASQLLKLLNDDDDDDDKDDDNDDDNDDDCAGDIIKFLK